MRDQNKRMGGTKKFSYDFKVSDEYIWSQQIQTGMFVKQEPNGNSHADSIHKLK